MSEEETPRIERIEAEATERELSSSSPSPPTLVATVPDDEVEEVQDHQEEEMEVVLLPVERTLSPSPSQPLPLPSHDEQPSVASEEAGKPVLQRIPSILSDSLSIKPDPPLIIDHLQLADDDKSDEFSPRGMDASEMRLSRSSIFGGVTGGADEDPKNQNELELHGYDVVDDAGQPLYINVPSFDLENTREAENDNESAHHLSHQVVESILLDEGVSTNPLASVQEHEVLLTTPMMTETTTASTSIIRKMESLDDRKHQNNASMMVLNDELQQVEPPVEFEPPRHDPVPVPVELQSSEPSPTRFSIPSTRIYDAPSADPLIGRPSSRPGPDNDVDFLPRVVEPTRAVRQQQQHQQQQQQPQQRKQQQQRMYTSFQTPVNLSYQPSYFGDGYNSNSHQHQHQQQPHHYLSSAARGGGGRRKIRLRLQEEVRQANNNTNNIKSTRRSSILGHLRTRSRQMMWGSLTSRDFNSSTSNFDPDNDTNNSNDNNDILESNNNKNNDNKSDATTVVDRGSITVSWFDGTSAIELQEHVRTSVARKLGLEKGIELVDMRILDEGSDPPEEIVLSPYIPDGSRFILRYSTRDNSNDGSATPLSIYSGRAPDSPSAVPSPSTSRAIIAGALGGDVNASQLALLRKQLNALKLPRATMQEVSVDEKEVTQSFRRRNEEEKKDEGLAASRTAEAQPQDETEYIENPELSLEGDDDDQQSKNSKVLSELEDDEDDMMLHSEDPIEARLRQITELLLVDRNKRRSKYSSRKSQKRQVIFVLANYFVLFLSFIAISAEIQSRAPGWLSSLENHFIQVQDCSKDKDALFQCVSNGDFAGLVASVLLYFSRSVATRRFFLFGFETPRKLWNVVYESLVTSFCWGFSYMFIRRGLNPDTRPQFMQKYWKDAVYGSLAGFNAAFMKQVLKNLIPQEAVEDVLRDRQMKILSWLPSFR